MLSFAVDIFRLEVEAVSGSDDALFAYDSVFLNLDDYEPTSKQAIRLYREDELLKHVLLGAAGGGTGVYPNTALLDGDRLVSCCDDTVFCLSVPELNLLWKTKADQATCFCVYQYQQDYIVHGELAISRLDNKGNIIWEESGADIFVVPKGDSSLKFFNDYFIATDFEYSQYKFDYDGNTISYTKID